MIAAKMIGATFVIGLMCLSAGHWIKVRQVMNTTPQPQEFCRVMQTVSTDECNQMLEQSFENEGGDRYDRAKTMKDHQSCHNFANNMYDHCRQGYGQ
jgi:hypothetical protein